MFDGLRQLTVHLVALIPVTMGDYPSDPDYSPVLVFGKSLEVNIVEKYGLK